MREGSPPHTCHMSGVTCHVSHVTCHMSHVKCHMSDFFLVLLIFFFGQNREASQGRVCYQRGLPRLVLSLLYLIQKYICWAKIDFSVHDKIVKNHISFPKSGFLMSFVQ